MGYPPLPQSVSKDAAVTSMIRAHCGWHVTPEINEIRTFDYAGHGRLFIPTLRLVDVQRVSVKGEALHSWSFSADGWLTFDPQSTPPAGDRVVTVEFKHGFAEAPELSLVLQRVMARLSSLPAAPLSYQRAGSQAVGYLSKNGEVLGFSLSDSEKEALAPYVLKVAPL